MNTNLEARILDSGKILITEDNEQKNPDKFPGLHRDTPNTIRKSLEKGRNEKIPPIYILKNPYHSIEKTIKSYEELKELILESSDTSVNEVKPAFQLDETEKSLLTQLLGDESFLCYNGNRRLEQFQRQGLPIRAFVIASQNDYEAIPIEEKRANRADNPDKKNYNPIFTEISKNYNLAYLLVLMGAIKIQKNRS